MGENKSNVRKNVLVYDLLLRFDSRREAEETAWRFRSAIVGNLDFAEDRLCIFYGGKKTVRVVQFEDSQTCVSVFRSNGEWILRPVYQERMKA